MRDCQGMGILITGGGSGIGAETARLFAERGARVTISGRRAERLAEVAASIGAACHVVVGDVASDSDRHRMLDSAAGHAGGRLDALINNAGNMYRQPVDAYDVAYLREAFDVNVIAGMMLSSIAVPFLEQSRGAIVFIGSTHTRRAFAGASPYATTKAAVEGLARVMAAELGPRGIRVGCVLPGAVATELNVRAGVMRADEMEARYAGIAREHVLGRIGTAREVAEGIEYLVRAEWVTGVALEVDGGIGLGASAGVAQTDRR
jgi:NAD(P)-dependent dehydrogenase (short-subunit alcohol dehydrogenase family)